MKTLIIVLVAILVFQGCAYTLASEQLPDNGFYLSSIKEVLEDDEFKYLEVKYVLYVDGVKMDTITKYQKFDKLKNTKTIWK